MSLLTRLIRNGSPFDNPAVPLNSANVEYFLDLFSGGGRGDANEIVTPITAMQTTAVWACVTKISEQIATSPLLVYEVDKKGKHVALDHPYYYLLHSKPNDEQDSVQFRTSAQASLLLWGNAYIQLQRDNSNSIRQMWLRHPAKTRALRIDGTLWYETTDNHKGDRTLIDADDMIHIMGMTFDGFNGVSPIEFARQTIGTNIAMDRFGAQFFGNFATPSLAIKTPNAVKPEDKARMRSQWEALQSGSNRHRVAILDNGMDVETISIPPEAAQFLESKMMTRRDIAAIFGVPPAMIGDVEKSVRANVEQQSIDFLNFCLKPWIRRWEIALSTKLFPTVGRNANKFIAKFDMREMLRPDAAARTTFYQSGIQNGVLSPDEAREMEGLNPLGNYGDQHFIQLNMQTLKMAKQVEDIGPVDNTAPNPTGDQGKTPKADPKTETDDTLEVESEENSLMNRIGTPYSGLYRDGLSRLLHRSKRDATAIRQCLSPTLIGIALSLRSLHKIPGDVLTTNDECYRAINKLVDGIERRASSWKEDDVESISRDELKRAMRSLVFATHKDLGTIRALKDIRELEDDKEE
jgi:HK97 family phage portal protein